MDSCNGLDVNAKDMTFSVSHQSAGHTRVDFKKQLMAKPVKNGILFSIPVFLNRRAVARYLALASVIPGLERFSWNLPF